MTHNAEWVVDGIENPMIRMRLDYSRIELHCQEGGAVIILTTGGTARNYAVHCHLALARRRLQPGFFHPTPFTRLSNDGFGRILVIGAMLCMRSLILTWRRLCDIASQHPYC
jgi:hypothetical protein